LRVEAFNQRCVAINEEDAVRSQVFPNLREQRLHVLVHCLAFRILKQTHGVFDHSFRHTV
jgi:hypothetical protein